MIFVIVFIFIILNISAYSLNTKKITIKLNDGLNLKGSYLKPKNNTKPPLVFIHGSNAGGWIYNENWLKFFFKKGWASYSLSMRGSQETGSLNSTIVSFKEHYSDLKEIIKYFNSSYQKPIIIAHSYGGLVLTKVLEDKKYRKLINGAVWLSSLPPSGEKYLLFRILGRINIFKIIPAVLQGNLDDRIYRNKFLFYNKCTLDEDIRRYNNLFDLDSQIKLDLNSINLELPKKSNFTEENKWINFNKKLVVGSYDDFILDRFSVHETAKLVNTKNIIFLRDSGHNLMLDHNWKNVARRILKYIKDW